MTEDEMVGWHYRLDGHKFPCSSRLQERVINDCRVPVLSSAIDFLFELEPRLIQKQMLELPWWSSG